MATSNSYFSTVNNPRYIFGLDHTNTKINLLIKVLKFAELGAAELQLQKEINDAEVRILSDQYALGKNLYQAFSLI